MQQTAMLTALTILLAVTAAPAKAGLPEGPWCANVSVGEDSYVERCDMRSYEQCRQEITGSGSGFCTQNPYYRPVSGLGEPKRRGKPKPR
jgi:hypothetical protein